VVERLRDPARHGDRLPHQLPIDVQPPYDPMVRQAEKICDLPVLAGNQVEFIPDAFQFLDRLVAEINSAQKSIHLNYYIFATDIQGHRAVDALIAAAGRGVECLVLAEMAWHRANFFGILG
jgi:cardiolipin synthase